MPFPRCNAHGHVVNSGGLIVQHISSKEHPHDAKGNRDRFVPLPTATLAVLRRFWQEHRNPELLFPNRHGGLKAAALARTPLDRGGVQRALRQVALACGIKKKSARTACATAMQLT